nr:MAG TPA: hypothetical protein [Caudoviricetes sp.]
MHSFYAIIYLTITSYRYYILLATFIRAWLFIRKNVSVIIGTI